jgi:iron(III) transport system permease protein
LMLNSALLGAGASLLAMLIGAPLGLIFARASFPMKRMLRIALITPLVIPPYIMALARIYIGGPAGLLAQLFGRDLLSDSTNSMAGAVIVLGAGFYPLAMLASAATFIVM